MEKTRILLHCIDDCFKKLEVIFFEDGRAKKVTCEKCGVIFERSQKKGEKHEECKH